MKQLLSTPSRKRWVASVLVAGVAHAIPVLWPTGPTASLASHAALALPLPVRALDVPVELASLPEHSSPVARGARPTAALRQLDASHAKPRARSRTVRAARQVAPEVDAAAPTASGENAPMGEETTPDTATAAAAVPSQGAAAERALPAAIVNKPRLLADANPCRGMFPARTKRDRAVVTLSLHVTKAGTALKPRILSELPAGEGFAHAAELCSERLRFQPGLDAAGQPIAAASVVRLHFAR